MAQKRRNTSSPEPDDGFSSAKRRNTREVEPKHHSDRGDRPENPHVDESSGQTGAFPGLGGDNDELFYGPASDGIDYLRMVRSEAKGVPHVLTTPVVDAQQDDRGSNEVEDEGGYYYDGAYTAIQRETTDEDLSLPSAQAYYYDSLLAQFRLVRATLRCSPPLSAVEGLRPSQFISFPENTRKVRSQWEAHMLSTDPHPVQLACMAADTVVELVRFLVMQLEKMLRTKDPVKAARVGAWVWAVLGKCQDRGELGSEEIGDLRQLAQLALQLQNGGRDKARDDDDENGIEHGVLEDEISANDGTVRTPASNDSKDIEVQQIEVDTMRQKMNTALDMIVTVVGDVYGQRDLLDLRLKWPDEG